MKLSALLSALLFPIFLLAQEERPFAGPIFNQITVSAIPSYQKELHGKLGYSFSAIRICNPSGDSHLFLGMEYNHYSSYSGSGSTSPHSGYTNEISEVSSFMIPLGIRIDSDSSKKFFFNLGALGEWYHGTSTANYYDNLSHGPNGTDTGSGTSIPIAGTLFGFNFGVGGMIPCGKINLVLKTDLCLKIPQYDRDYTIVPLIFRFGAGIYFPQTKRSIQKIAKWKAAHPN